MSALSASGADLFPDLPAERAHLALSHRCRLEMIRRLEAVVAGQGAADEITQEYIEMVVADALVDLDQPGTGDFFGRIDEESGERWYVGRLHIEDDDHDPVVVDWRAAVAAPFYRATVHDPFGLRMRRRFTLADGELIAYLDEHLDDPDAADVAGGVPDPVLAEIGAARSGEMREIVATIQAEQDHIIRAPLAGAVIVQGGPGTGKTAVGLHRAAYLLFEHRRLLAREGVLVVGPNRVFLDYIGNVLPSLGERSVQQRTVAELASPRVEVIGTDSVDAARVKGRATMATVLERAARALIVPPAEPVREPLGSTSVVVDPPEAKGWIDTALAGTQPLNRRREALRAVAEQALRRRTGRDDIWSLVPAIRAALARAWPVVRPRPLVERLLARPDVLAEAADGLLTAEEQQLVLTRAGRPKRWTAADQVLLDTANSLLNGPPATVGHVVVDEAQDLSALALAAVSRRCPTGSLTILGDLAQSTGPAGQSSWEEVIRHLGSSPTTAVEHLTIGYRVPAPILDVANRLLPATGVDVPASRSVRREGAPPGVRIALEPAVAAAEEIVSLRRHHKLSGVIAPEAWLEPVARALAAAGLVGVGRVQGVADDEVPVLGYELVKGLELDGVVVLNPHEVLDGSERGARLVYVAMTRAVQQLTIVSSEEPPAILRAGNGGAGAGASPPTLGGYVAGMSDAPSEDHSEPVVVATYTDLGEAEVAQAKLRAFGIESVILDQAEGGTIPTIELPLGIGVEVKAVDADDAVRILAEPLEI